MLSFFLSILCLLPIVVRFCCQFWVYSCVSSSVGRFLRCCIFSVVEANHLSDTQLQRTGYCYKAVTSVQLEEVFHD
jgi:hypothetical protein